MNFKGKNKCNTNSEGWERNANKFFKQLSKKHPEYFSDNNMDLIKNKKSPVVDEVFVASFPDYSEYSGDKLIHHHIGGGGQAATYPETLHNGFGGVHNFEKESGVTGNDKLTEIAQTIEPGIKKKKKRKKASSSQDKTKGKCKTK